MNKLIPLFAYEFLAEFFFVAIGCAGLVGKTAATDSAAFGLHMGLVGTVVVHTFGFLSGAILNPPMVIASFLAGALSITKVIVYLIAEFAGAIAGYYSLVFLLGESATTGATPPLCKGVPNAEFTDAQITAIEFFVSSVLILGMLSMLDTCTKPDVMTLRYGSILGISVLFGILHTGTGLNSALNVASSVAANNYDKLPLYLGGQFGAAVVASLLWKLFFKA